MNISLLYHDILSAGSFPASGFESADADIYKLDEATFARHLEAIGHAGAGLAEELFTFDDGGASALLAASMLEKRGWRGWFFITTDRIGTPGFVCAEDIAELRRRGHTIGSHSCSHPPRMAQLSRGALVREWGASVAALSAILGEPVTCASVPGGYYSRRVAEAAAECGIAVLFTSEPVASTRRVAGTLVRGRYSVKRNTSAARAAALAHGDLAPRLGQFCYWNAKKLLKAGAGRYWLAFRKYYFARSKNDTWT